MKVYTLVSPSANFDPANQLQYGVSIDGGNVASVEPMPLADAADSPAGWDGNTGFVANSIVQTLTQHNVTSGAAGKHTLRVWMVTPGIVLQKIVIDMGGMRSSYLGPPESLMVGM